MQDYKQRGIAFALEAMTQETDIIDMIKSIRFFKLALKKLLSREERMSLKEKGRYRFMDPDTFINERFGSEVQLLRLGLGKLGNVF